MWISGEGASLTPLLFTSDYFLPRFLSTPYFPALPYSIHSTLSHDLRRLHVFDNLVCVTPVSMTWTCSLLQVFPRLMRALWTCFRLRLLFFSLGFQRFLVISIYLSFRFFFLAIHAFSACLVIFILVLYFRVVEIRGAAKRCSTCPCTSFTIQVRNS